MIPLKVVVLYVLINHVPKMTLTENEGQSGGNTARGLIVPAMVIYRWTRAGHPGRDNATCHRDERGNDPGTIELR